MAKVYTGQGDDGKTVGLDGAERLKCDPVVEAVGAVDELSANLGWCMAALEDDSRIGAILDEVQHDLMAAGARLSAGTDLKGEHRFPVDAIGRAEAWIDEIWERLPPLDVLLLPRGVEAAARLHIARAVCRRAERSVVSLGAQPEMPADVMKYLNRLGDLLYAMARAVNLAAGSAEQRWDV